MPSRKYLVVPFYTGCVGGGLDEKKLTGTLNEKGNQGWRLRQTIHETKKVFLIFQRETHFLIFEKED
jgi:hypothetical protein